MEEEKEPKKTDDIKKIESTQDFEMGSDDKDEPVTKQADPVQKQDEPVAKQDEPVQKKEEAAEPAAGTESPSSPKVKHYMRDVKKPDEPQPEQHIDPTAQPPGPHPQQSKMFHPKEGQTIGQAKSGQALPGKKKSVPNPAIRKKAILGCLGAFGSIMLIFLVFAFIFVAQSGEEVSPLAKLLGVNQASFVNSLITLIHIIFILVSLVAFVFTMIGLFRASMAKKGDKETKKSGLKMSLISGVVLIIILISWMFVYVYLDAKRIQLSPGVKDPIITEPEETLNLTAPIEIKFDASNVPVDSGKFQIISYEWDFGDGEIGTDRIVIHKYEKKGRYDVVLDVTLKNKKTGEELPSQYSVIVSIANQALTASFVADPRSGEAPLEVEFDASESVDPDGTIDRYEWDLDEDGEFDDAEGITVTHEFEKIGIYIVALRVTNTLGDYDIGEKEIVVEEAEEPEPVITVIDEPQYYITGLNYVFTADESTSPNGKIEEYEWDFGDGEIKTTKTTSHIFENEGTYEVTLKVTDEEEKEGETTKVITIGSPQGTPKAKIKTDPELPGGALKLEGKAPFIVVFDASGTTDSDSNIVEYEWDFDGNGTTDGYGKTATYTYQNEGTYTATLTVTDADDNVGTAFLAIKVEAKGIEAVLNANKVEGNIPLTVTFDATGSTYDNGRITSYEWDFGDGTVSKLGAASKTHKYTSIGTYTAVVTVIGSDNSSSTAEILITVREIPLSACFVSVFAEGPAPLETTFDPGCSTGTIASYFWDFGDGGTATDVKPTHVFVEAGEYTVTLEVADAENTVDAAELTITVIEN